jgi:hypothetical protein
MKRVILYVLAAVIVVAGLGAAVPPLRQRARQLAADLKIINADTGDVMASATYQRFARRREAVASMRAALLQVAVIESTFVADSGRPTVSLFERYVPKDQYLLGPSVTIQRDRWVATVSHRNTTMSCKLTAMVDPMTFDSITWRYHVGEPVCAGWSAESTAIANAPVPINPAPEPTPQSPTEPLRAPRHRRDWGPVNNTPPPMPYIAANTCQGEGCVRSGTWAACSTLVALQEKQNGAPSVFTIQPGEKFTALTGDVHVEVPGMVVFRDTISSPVDERGAPADSILFTPADTLYVLNVRGEGYLVWWFRGQAMDGYQFWAGEPFGVRRSRPTDPAVVVRGPRSVWWVHVRNLAGREGWIRGDYRKMATSGYMDEIERCLHTAKG